ncbi:zinc-binding protein A33-like [Salvelinus fontinalis]|uniref:zinc-binding protein A33-like n=1 Tax=Salvelinus fontinalis TaxID=8038 RepID=UPI0024854C08|nr:zinc-binding protein A33-like [Salvelinus fontinalis]
MSSLNADSSLLPEEQFLCSICLNVFTDPVTTPCGHTFCKVCISGHWDNSEICQCLKCPKRFYVRPEVSTNAVIEEISVHIKKRKLDIPECSVSVGEVACDVCSTIKLRALKSCLVCLTSYCEIHLEPHQRVVNLKRHKLIDPVNNLEDRMCKKHERGLELFCRTDQTCVCVLCTETDHKCHNTVPIEEEGVKQKAELVSTKAEVQKMIQDRHAKMEEIKRSVVLSQKSTEKEVEDSEKLFTELLQSIKKRRAKLVKVIEERQKAAERRAEGLTQQLEQEITELQKRSTELEQLSHTEDHLHLLQVSSLPSLRTPPSTKKWPRVTVNTDLCVGTLRRALSQIEENIRGELKVLTEMELTRMQEFKDEVTLDPNTANRWLQLSEDGMRTKYAKTAQTVSDNPKRFDYYSAVLGEKGFNSGRHYWEVQVGVSGRWEVGIAMRAVNRKKAVKKNSEHGFFVLSKSGYLEYEAGSSPPTTFNLNPIPRRVGVYVDYEKGQVSFYDVLAKSHLYSFLGLSFTGKLYPYFYLYSMKKKSESLVIYIDWIKKCKDHLRRLSNTAK